MTNPYTGTDVTGSRSLDTRRWAQCQTAVAELARQALSGAAFEALATEAMRSAGHLLSVSHAEIAIPDDESGDSLRRLAGFGWRNAETGRSVYPLADDAMATAVLAASGPVLVPDIGGEARFRPPPHVADAGLACGAAIAIGDAHSASGLLAVYSREPREFDDCDLGFLRALTLVLEGAASADRRDRQSRQAMTGLEDELRERLGHLELVRDVTGLIDGARSPAAAIEAALGHVCERLGWPLAHAFTLAPADNGLRHRLWWPPARDLLPEAERDWYCSHENLQSNPVRRAVLDQGRAQWCANLGGYRQEADILRRLAAPAGGVLAVPVAIGQETVGVAEFFLPDARSPAPGLIDTLSLAGARLGRAVERGRMAAEIDRRDRGMTDMANALPGLFALLDRDCRYRFANDRHARWLDLDGASLLGRTLQEVWGDEVTAAIAADIRHVLSGQHRRFEMTLPHKELGQRSVWVVLTPQFDANGCTTGFYLAGSDITERKAADRRARRHQAELALMSRSAILAEVAGTIAHDLNQPLSAIATYAGAARRLLHGGRLEADENSEILDRIEEMARQAGTKLRQLRELAQGEGAGLEPVDLGLLATQAARLMDRSAHDAGITVDLRLAENLPPIRGNAEQLRQLVVNLLTNAIEAVVDNPPGEPRHIEVCTRVSSGDDIELSVTDTGPGASPETLRRVFQPFFTTKSSGLGMGLAISSSAAEAHGGKLSVAANPHRGVTFTLRLPPSPAA